MAIRRWCVLRPRFPGVSVRQRELPKLVVLRNGQYVFREVIERYMKQISYDSDAAVGYANRLLLPGWAAEGRICVGADKRILSAARPWEIAAVLRYEARYLLFAHHNLRDADRLRIFRRHLEPLTK